MAFRIILLFLFRCLIYTSLDTDGAVYPPASRGLKNPKNLRSLAMYRLYYDRLFPKMFAVLTDSDFYLEEWPQEQIRAALVGVVDGKITGTSVSI